MVRGGYYGVFFIFIRLVRDLGVYYKFVLRICFCFFSCFCLVFICFWLDYWFG